MISDKASACPHCGCPVDNNATSQEETYYDEIEEKSKVKIWILTISLLCLLAGGCYFVYTKIINDNKNDKDAIVELTPEFIKAIEKYDRLGIFSEGMAAVCKDGKWGYINTKGEEVIPVTIDAFCVGRFSEGLAFVLYKEDGPFSVINTKGEIVFKGEEIDDFWEYAESEDMPYYINGKLYITILTAGYDEVYDIQGNKIDSINFEENNYTSIYADSIDGNYIVFLDDSYVVGEADWSVSRTKWGLKDSTGKVVFSAKYDYTGGNYADEEQKIDVSNGVILVILEELEEDQYTGEGNKQPKRHYGYADLKGNDTFSEALKERCRKAERLAMDNYQKQLDEEIYNYEEEDYEDGDYEDGDYDYGNDLSYNSERIVTVYIKGEYGDGGKPTCESNYGISEYGQMHNRLITNSIVVPYGKVWIFKDYRCTSSNNNLRYEAGFCDDTGWRAIVYRDEKKHYGQGWRSIDEMGGERYYGGKRLFMFWNPNYGTERYSTFTFEANFIEKDE